MIKIHQTRPDPIFTVMTDDVVVCEWLLEAAGVALALGTAFGSVGQIRFSYAVSQDTLENAVNRVAKAAATLC